MKYKKLLTILTVSLLSTVALIGCDNKEKNTTVAQKETVADNKIENTVEVQLLQTLSANLKLTVAAKELPAQTQEQPQEVAYNEASESYSYSEPQQATNDYGIDEAALVSFLLANSTHPEYGHFMTAYELYYAGWQGNFIATSTYESENQETVNYFIEAYTNGWLNYHGLTSNKMNMMQTSYYTDGVNLYQNR